MADRMRRHLPQHITCRRCGGILHNPSLVVVVGGILLRISHNTSLVVVVGVILLRIIKVGIVVGISRSGAVTLLQ